VTDIRSGRVRPRRTLTTEEGRKLIPFLSAFGSPAQKMGRVEMPQAFLQPHFREFHVIFKNNPPRLFATPANGRRSADRSALLRSLPPAALDYQKRLIIPRHLRRHFVGELLFMGLGRSFVIWNNSDYRRDQRRRKAVGFRWRRFSVQRRRRPAR
jgi:hypothetical protein